MLTTENSTKFIEVSHIKIEIHRGIPRLNRDPITTHVKSG